MNKRAQLTHHHPEIMLAEHHPTVDTLRFTKLPPDSEQTNSSVVKFLHIQKKKKENQKNNGCLMIVLFFFHILLPITTYGD